MRDEIDQVIEANNASIIAGGGILEEEIALSLVLEVLLLVVLKV